MPDNSSRRQWIRNTAAAVAAMSISPSLFATERERYRAAGIILLNSNENAYGPSAATRQAMAEALINSNRYPDEQIPVLKQQIAEFWGVGKENILMGAGSSEILGLTSLMVSSPKGHVIIADPCYRVWNSQAEAFGLTFKRIPLANDKTHDLGEMMAAIDGNTRMIYV